ncbi:efflux RND transporter permease subunit [Hyphomonas pacifica]|uniref:RND transporter n=1 Tax=Hyphomonas pacifica TaxID=1280941 RepID=A0A062TUX2_9PROT|nr:efflux RND transporter permease subunit [Hyphomonas pacifica]KCZ48406.1 RND transporter [Hyphomonas pacifica]RAN31718.1 RND transporter [Hyphomonas pacifica]RAN32111.1 RND transporter [Hyphomonas pacifica]
MNGIVAWFARNAVAANLLMIVAFVGGVFGYTKMEQEMFPVVNVTGASVSVAWNGASPQDVEEQIVTRIEEAVADINGLDRITSIANEGFGVVNIKGRDDIDMDKFLDDVKLRVDQINNMPQAAFQPQVTRWEQRNSFMGLAIHGNVDERTLKRLGDKVRDDIANIRGGELAELNGVIDEQVNIEVSEEALRRFGISFSDVANAIRQSSLNSSGGRIESSSGDVAITARQLADTAKQFGNIIIRQTTEDGTIRVDDVASIDDGFVTDKFQATFNGEPTVFVMIPSPDTMHILDYTKSFHEYVKKANDPANGILPQAVKVDVLWDDSEGFQDRMDLITQSALQGAVLVMLVLILFLRPTVALWVTAGIITAFAGGIMLLPYFGVSWNILSTFAVLLVIGVIVDDAIVVGENIHREIESGRSEGLDAAIIGTQMVLKPVIFGVLTTIIAFLPWAFITGPTRMFTQQITFVVVAALIFSVIECMLILPSHLSHMKKQKFDGPSGKLLRLQHSIADSLLWFANNIYKPVLEVAIRFRYATVALFFCLFYLATQVSGMGIVPFKFMPEIEADMIQVEISMPEGTPYERLIQVRDQLQAGIQKTKQEAHQEFPNIEGDIITDASVVASGTSVRSWISIIPPEERPVGLRSREVSEFLRNNVGDIQDAEEVTFDFTFNDEQSGVRFALNHPNLERLREAAAVVKEHLSTYNNAYDIGDNLSSAAEEIRISMKPGAETLGITLADVSQQVRQAYFGEEVQRLPRDGEDVRVMVRLPESARENLDSLSALKVRTPDGREIPITQVANFEYAPGINRIIRRNRTRSVSVYAEVMGEGGRGQIMSAMEQDFWPDFQKQFPDVQRGEAGGFEEEQKFFAEIGRLILIAIGTMYILLAVAFRSYAQPILLMMALPFAYCGAVFGLWIFNTPMAMFSFFGIAAAAGVVINDNLVLIDYVNRRRDEGAGAVQALVDGGVSRFRPILLTSVTTFVGILPLIAEKSVQAQFLKPMVVSLGAAVAFALFVSLLMVPAMYAVGVEIGRIFQWTWGGKPYRQIGETYSGEVTIDEEELIGTSHSDGLGRAAPAE